MASCITVLKSNTDNFEPGGMAVVVRKGSETASSNHTLLWYAKKPHNATNLLGTKTERSTHKVQVVGLVQKLLPDPQLATAFTAVNFISNGASHDAVSAPSTNLDQAHLWRSQPFPPFYQRYWSLTCNSYWNQ